MGFKPAHKPRLPHAARTPKDIEEIAHEGCSGGDEADVWIARANLAEASKKLLRSRSSA
jgi:hypothetical protein